MTDAPDAADDADPWSVRALAVHAEDVVTALEARERGRKRAVLRLSPPYAGRMRARIHVATEGEYADRDDEERPVHVSPEAFVDDPPTFPTVDDTEDRLRERDAYSVETHREAHADAVADWRRTVRERLADRVALPLDGEDHVVEVSYLG